MSIKLMAQVWERKLSKAEQSVLLAMADHAQDDGTRCYPSVDWIAWKTDYSARQVQRTIKELCARGVLLTVRGYGRGRPVEYRIVLSKTEAKPEYTPKGDTASPQSKKGDIVSGNAPKGDIVSPQADAQTGEKGDIGDVKGDIGDVKGDIHAIKGDIAMSPEPLEPYNHKGNDDDDARVRDPVHAAWYETYGAEMSPEIEKATNKLLDECREEAVIHGIRVSINAKSRSFRFIAAAARNYIPPAPATNGSGYRVDIPDVEFMPGVHPMQPAPAQNGHSPPPLPAPLPHDDPWAIALPELLQTLTGSAPRWLADSRLVPNGELAGVPMYRLIVTQPGANAQWLTQQAEPAIRKKLSSLLGHRVLLEISAAQQEKAP